MKPIRVSKLKIAWLIAVAICVWSAVCFVQRSHACREQNRVLLSLGPKMYSVGFRPIWPRFLEPYLPRAGPLWRLAVVRDLGLTGANERDVQFAAELPYLEELVLEEPDVTSASLIQSLQRTKIRSLCVLDSLTDTEIDELRRGLPDVKIEILRSR